ncbi:MAG: hypothetical protein QF491_09340 [Alphaproteobacteria bacterium]|nr:hypothetical protein [Alphaproteobacteria bacterium]
MARFEDQPAGWARLQRQCPWLPDLSVVNASEHDNWETYCDVATRAIAEVAYAEDMALWARLPRA